MNLTALAPISRQTIQDRVYQALRQSLVSGLFESGEVLRIQAVAESLETSTMPVRDALARLVADQALEMLPNRSVRVPMITRERLEDISRVRALVEGEAVVLATPRLSHDDIVTLSRLTERYDSAVQQGHQADSKAVADLNYQFHQTIYQAAGSATLLPIIDSLWLQSGPFIRAAAQRFDDQENLSATHHHWIIIDAVERGDSDAARRALLEDISRAFDILRENFEALELQR